MAEFKEPSPSRGGYGGLGAKKKAGGYGGLARELTYTELDKRKQHARPQTLPPSALEKLDMAEQEEGAQSARAATSSWSLTGGTREASFKKRRNDDGSKGSKPPSSVGFASVLSLSGWSDVDAQEVTVGSDNKRGSTSERGEKEPEGVATFASEPSDVVGNSFKSPVEVGA